MQQVRDALADLVQPLDAKRERHASLGAEEIHRDGIRGCSARQQRWALEQQRRPASRGLHAPVRDLGDLLVHGGRDPDPDELARRVDRAQEVAQIIECHGGRRRCRR